MLFLYEDIAGKKDSLIRLTRRYPQEAHTESLIHHGAFSAFVNRLFFRGKHSGVEAIDALFFNGSGGGGRGTTALCKGVRGVEH